jgi:hypothetical protein
MIWIKAATSYPWDEDRGDGMESSRLPPAQQISGGRTSMSTISSLALSVLALAATAGADRQSLPLRPGVYVDAGSECRGAASSAKTWFGGGFVIQAPHAQCTLRSVAHPHSDTFRVVKQCNENGDVGMKFRLVDHIRIISPTEYQIDNRFGRFHSRWCHG